MHKRIIAIPAQPPNLLLLLEEARAAWPDDVLDVNEINDGEYIAFYIADTETTLTDEDAQIVMDAHNPAQLTRDQYIAIIEQMASVQIAAIPGWATWTEAEALAWLDANVTGTVPADVETWMRAMTRMVIALRNKTWPELEAGQG